MKIAIAYTFALLFTLFGINQIIGMIEVIGDLQKERRETIEKQINQM